MDDGAISSAESTASALDEDVLDSLTNVASGLDAVGMHAAGCSRCDKTERRKNDGTSVS